MSTGRWVRLRHLIRWTAAVMVIALVGSGAYLGLVLIRRSRTISLPVPTGHYPVGRTWFEWTDVDRADPLAPRAGTRRLSVWLWYPARSAIASTAHRSAYAPNAWKNMQLPSPVGWAETSLTAIRTNSVTDVPVADGAFPVLVFEPGLGFAALQYSSLAEALAAQGYLVAGVTPTYSANVTVLGGAVVKATPRGDPSAFDTDDLHTPAVQSVADDLVRVWAADARFTARKMLNLSRTARFTGHIDARYVVYLGHSFGGAASLQACSDDLHCAGAVDLDGGQFGDVARTGLDRPFMIMASQGSCVTGHCSGSQGSDPSDRAVADRFLAASSGTGWCYEIPGAGHFNFTDYGIYYLAAPLRHLLALGHIDGPTALAITADRLKAFVGFAMAGTISSTPPGQPHELSLIDC